MRVRYAFFLMMLVSMPPISLFDHNSDVRKSIFKSKEREREREAIDKRNRIDDVKFFESISENSPPGPYSMATKPHFPFKHRHSKEESLAEIKSLLGKLLEKIEDIENEQKNDSAPNVREGDFTQDYSPSSSRGYTMPIYSEQTMIPSSSPKLSLIQRIERRRRKKERKEEKRQRWGKWTNWSPCSVSCGKGREIRWRHCLENCDVAETEMEEKTCQLPACGPSKLFGVIKL